MKKMPAIGVAGIFVRGFVRGESRDQGALFPVSLDELVPENYACRVIDALADSLDLLQLEFRRAEAAVTRRPVYDPADLLKLYLNGFLQQYAASGAGVPRATSS